MAIKVSVGVGVLGITLFVYVVSLAVWIATLKTGENSVSLVADRHRAEVARSTRNRIDDQLSASEKLTATNALMFKNGVYQHPDRQDPRGVEADHFLTAFRSQLYGSRFVTTVSMTDYRGNLFGVYTNFDFTSAGMWEQYTNATTNEPTLLDYSTQLEGDPQEGQKVALLGTTAPFNSSEQVWYTVTDPYVQNSNAWTPMYFFVDSGEVTAFLSQSHVARRSDGSLIGVVSIDMATGFVGTMLNEVGHKDMLTYCVDVFEDALLGTSTEDETVTCTSSGKSLADCPVAEQAFVKPTNSKNGDVESTTKAILSKFNNDWKNVESTQFQSGDYLISVEMVVKNKLRWAVVVVVPESTILSEMRKNTELMIVLQSVCGVLQIILAVAFALVVRRPLSKLVDQMEGLKRFETDEKVEGNALFSEVKQLQKGHESLRISMGRVKSFVPQSVLAELTGETYEEDDEGTVSRETSEVQRGSSKIGGDAMSGMKSPKSAHSDVSQTTGGTSLAPGALIGIGLVNNGVSNRRVSVLSCNVRNFHSLCQGAVGDHVRDIMETLVSTTVSIAKKHRGMLDYFQGDHFVFSFNAATNNAGHCKNAVLTAMECVEAAAALPENKFEMHCGVGTSNCAIGNMGSSVVKRFGIIGPAFSQAVALEKLCRCYKDIKVLTVRQASMDCEGSVLMQAVDIVSVGGNNRTAIFVPRVSQEHGSTQEWMYDLEQSPFSVHNQRFEAFLAQEVTPPSFPAPTPAEPQTPEELLDALVKANVDGRTYVRRSI